MRRYYARVEEANLRFSAFKPGWKTDRGMVYVRYGEPDTTISSPPNMDGVPPANETWVYFRAGEKPLFYRHHRDRLVFASELKALFADPAVPREVDPEALDHYLAYGYVPGGLCLVRGVRKLPPAHSLWFDLRSGRLTIDKYWSPPRPQATDATLDELTSRMEQLLTDAVRRVAERLRTQLDAIPFDQLSAEEQINAQVFRAVVRERTMTQGGGNALEEMLIGSNAEAVMEQVRRIEGIADAESRVTRQTDPKGGETRFAYTPSSTTVTNPRGHQTRYEITGGLMLRGGSGLLNVVRRLRPVIFAPPISCRLPHTLRCTVYAVRSSRPEPEPTVFSVSTCRRKRARS